MKKVVVFGTWPWHLQSVALMKSCRLILAASGGIHILDIIQDVI